MADLKQLYIKLGLTSVQSYIQSGNVVFQSELSDLHALEQKIARGIQAAYSFEVPVIVMEIGELQSIVSNNPFLADPSKAEGFLHVTFLSDFPGQPNISKLMEVPHQGPDEEFVILDKAVYLYCPNGYGNTKLNNTFFESKLKTGATTRNWKTTRELLNIALKY